MGLTRVAGGSYLKILMCHIVLGVINTVVVIAAVSALILADSALSFLTAAIPSPTPAWGIEVGAGVHDEVHLSHRKGKLPIRPGGAVVRLIPSSRIFCCE